MVSRINNASKLKHCSSFFIENCFKNFKNISINIYETGCFNKFDERDPDTNFFDDITNRVLSFVF